MCEGDGVTEGSVRRQWAYPTVAATEAHDLIDFLLWLIRQRFSFSCEYISYRNTGMPTSIYFGTNASTFPTTIVDLVEVTSMRV